MHSILKIVIPRIAWAYLHFVGKTSRVVWRRKDVRYAVEAREKNFIYAFWHGRQVFIAYAYRNLPVTAMVSQSKDGEYIARVIELFGGQTVRGSSSRGGMKAVVNMKRHLDAGRIVGLTPDGPRGPQRSVASGILYLAQKTGKPIVPLAYSARRKLIFRGWDDYWIPLPFNRIALSVGEPVRILETDSLEKKAEELKRTLNETTAHADQAVTESSPIFESLTYAVYTLLAALLSPLIIFALFLRYPKTFLGHCSEGLGERLALYGKKSFETLGHPVWIHASSLGECRAALPLVNALRLARPGQKIIFTATTPNGVREARKLKLGDAVRYAPIDCPFTVNRFLAAVQPRMLLLLESELWPNWLSRTRDHGIPVGIINGRMSERSARRYQTFSFLTRILFRKIDFAAVREQGDFERFAACGVSEKFLSVAGNMKYDIAPWELNGGHRADDQDAHTKPEPSTSANVWVAGSVRDGEETLVLETHQRLLQTHPSLKLVLAPRHTESIGSLLSRAQSMGFKTALRSRLAAGENAEAWNVQLWDTFGDLWRAYESADIVFVGGSLVPKGGQNPIEPAWFGKPILFGPSMENFTQPSNLLLSRNAAIQIKDRVELENEIAALLNDPRRAAELCERSRSAMDEFRGQATQNTLAAVETRLRS